MRSGRVAGCSEHDKGSNRDKYGWQGVESGISRREAKRWIPFIWISCGDVHFNCCMFGKPVLYQRCASLAYVKAERELALERDDAAALLAPATRLPALLLARARPIVSTAAATASVFGLATVSVRRSFGSRRLKRCDWIKMARYAASTPR